MSHWDGVLHRLRVLTRRSQYTRELEAEREFHLELAAMHHQHSSTNPDLSEANAYARRRFGNMITHTEDARVMAGLGFVDMLSQDARFASRSFRRSPVFTVVAIVTLGVGIGANIAIFSAMDALLLRPLPFAHPEELMKVSLIRPAIGESPRRDDMVWSYPKFLVFRQQQQVFSDAALHTDLDVTVRTLDGAERVHGEVTQANYFSVLGTHAALGRVFLPDEDSRADGPKVVLISAKYWQRRFNADSQVVGTTIQIGASPFVVVGVLSEGFRGMTGVAEVWLPLLENNPDAAKEPWGHAYEMVARRKAGVTVAAAKATTAQLGAVVDLAYPHPEFKSSHFGAIARELDATRIDPVVRNSLFILLGAVGIVLLIACANVANLFLIRASGRAREIAVRLAVGASRKRLIRQLLTESLILSTGGGVAGIGVAFVCARFVASFDAARTLRVRNLSGIGAVRFDGIHLSTTALGLALLLAVATGFLFGLVPALQSTRPSLSDALKNAKAHNRSSRLQSFNGRSVFVSVEIALAFILLAGCGLMLRSLHNLVGIAPGFAVQHLLTLRFNGSDDTLRDSLPGFYDTALERLAAIPGVQGATIQDCPPLNGGCNGTALVRRDRPAAPAGADPDVGVHWVANNWLAVSGVGLIKGRAFTSSDRKGAPKVVLVSESAARRIWPGEDAIGKPVSVLQGGFDKDTAHVVGIVSDVHYGAIDDGIKPDVYLPFAQSPRSRMMIMIRGANPTALINPVRVDLHRLAPDLPVYDVRTMEDRAADSTAYTKFITLLLSTFGALALALATLGVYGVIAFTVSQRTKEIGIRMALGARVSDVTQMVVRQAFLVTAAGAAFGAAIALGVSRVLGSLLYGVTPADPLTFVSILGVLAAAVAIASLVPARRAASIHPTQALRED